MELVMFDPWMQIVSIFRSQVVWGISRCCQEPVSVDVAPNIVSLDSILRQRHQYLISFVFIQHTQSSICRIDIT